MTTTLDDFEHYIHQAITAYTEKEEIWMLKSEIEMLKEENSKLKHHMSEKEMLIKRLRETLNEEMAKQMWQTETRQTQRHQSWKNITLEKRNRFPPIQNTQDEVFSGATLKHLKHYIVPSIIDETLDRIILLGWYNDAKNKNSTSVKIANEIADIAMPCRDYGVNDIFISAIICRKGKFLSGKVKRVNNFLKLLSEENGYFFIDNSSIEIRD